MTFDAHAHVIVPEITRDAEAVLSNPEMAALYFGGSVEQAKDQPVARA